MCAAGSSWPLGISRRPPITALQTSTTESLMTSAGPCRSILPFRSSPCRILDARLQRRSSGDSYRTSGMVRATSVSTSPNTRSGPHSGGIIRSRPQIIHPFGKKQGRVDEPLVLRHEMSLIERGSALLHRGCATSALSGFREFGAGEYEQSACLYSLLVAVIEYLRYFKLECLPCKTHQQRTRVA